MNNMIDENRENPNHGFFGHSLYLWEFFLNRPIDESCILFIYCIHHTICSCTLNCIHVFCIVSMYLSCTVSMYPLLYMYTHVSMYPVLYLYIHVSMYPVLYLYIHVSMYPVLYLYIHVSITTLSAKSLAEFFSAMYANVCLDFIVLLYI